MSRKIIITTFLLCVLPKISFCMERSDEKKIQDELDRIALIDEELARRADNNDGTAGQPPATPREQELLTVISGLQRMLADRNSYNGHGYGAPWWKESKMLGKDYAKKICIKHLSTQIFGKEGATLDAAFQRGFFDGLWPTMKGVSVMAATSGFIDAADKAVAKAGDYLFDAIGSKLSDAWENFKRYVFHKGSKQINDFDLSRWGGAIKNMIESLLEIADQAKTSARIEPDIGLLHLNDFSQKDDDAAKRDAREQPAQPQSAVDKNWQEIARGYLVGILQMVAEMEFRQKYYGEPEKNEISFCLERLKVALIGDASSMITGEDGILEPGGGVYARIAQAKSLAELAATQTVTTLQLFKKHIIGIIGELKIWVKAKRGEERKKNGYSSGNSYATSYNDFGFDE